MKNKLGMLALLVLATGLGTVARADIVEVTATGEVDFNSVDIGGLTGVAPGDSVSLTFRLDSDIFLDSGVFPTRGYLVDLSSFELMIGGVSLGIANPYPGTPYFVIRDNDPAVDGFFLGNSPDGGPGVTTAEPGSFGNFDLDFLVTYGNDPLASLDILDALGTYDFTGLTVFSFDLSDGPFNALGITFSEMTIAAIAAPMPAPATLWLFAPLLVLLARQRRRQS